jgi:hypothetical protein
MPCDGPQTRPVRPRPTGHYDVKLSAFTYTVDAEAFKKHGRDPALGTRVVGRDTSAGTPLSSYIDPLTRELVLVTFGDCARHAWFFWRARDGALLRTEDEPDPSPPAGVAVFGPVGVAPVVVMCGARGAARTVCPSMDDGAVMSPGLAGVCGVYDVCGMDAGSRGRFVVGIATVKQGSSAAFARALDGASLGGVVATWAPAGGVRLVSASRTHVAFCTGHDQVCVVRVGAWDTPVRVFDMPVGSCAPQWLSMYTSGYHGPCVTVAFAEGPLAVFPLRLAAYATNTAQEDGEINGPIAHFALRDRKDAVVPCVVTTSWLPATDGEKGIRGFLRVWALWPFGERCIGTAEFSGAVVDVCVSPGGATVAVVTTAGLCVRVFPMPTPRAVAMLDHVDRVLLPRDVELPTLALEAVLCDEGDA